ncbi:hypothetical protein ABK040_003917 [Willaertia magna]
MNLDNHFGKPNPNYEAPDVSQLCNEQQLEALNELKKKCQLWIPELAIEEQEFMQNEGDILYYRYLLGYGFDKVKEAEEGLKQTCEWRAKTKPYLIKLDDLKEAGTSGWMFHYGYDKQNRPIVYVDTKKDNLPMTEENLRLKYLSFIYFTEQCIKRMPKNVFQISWVVDISNADISLKVVKQMKETFLALGIYYCERLSLAFVSNVNMTINLIWKFVSSFLSSEVVSRYYVLKKDEKLQKDAYLKHIDEEQLVTEFLGNASFNFDSTKLKELEVSKCFSSFAAEDEDTEGPSEGVD